MKRKGWSVRQIDRSMGLALRAARTRAGFTMSALAEAANISQPHLSQMENGKASPSINALYRIAGALNITPQELLPPVHGDVVTVMRKGEIPEVPLNEDANAARARILLGGSARGLQVQEITVREGDSLGEWFEHSGEELVIVSAGALVVEIDQDSPVELQAGDAISYPSSLPHRWRAIAPFPASIIAVANSQAPEDGDGAHAV